MNIDEKDEKLTNFYFVAKVRDYESLSSAFEGVWGGWHRKIPPQPSEQIKSKFDEGRVWLIFSVSHSKSWCGYARISSPPRSSDTSNQFTFDIDNLHFLPENGSIRLTFSQTSHLSKEDDTPVNLSRNYDLIPANAGTELCALIDNLLVDAKIKTNANQNSLPNSLSQHLSLDSDDDIWKDFLQVVKPKGTVVVASSFGSVRYNLSLKDSDMDILVIFMHTKEELLSLDVPKETFKNSQQERHDYCILEIRRYFELLLCGDSKAVEMLFLPFDVHREFSPMWQKIVAVRHLFLNRLLFDKYMSEVNGTKGLQLLLRLEEFEEDEFLSLKASKIAYVVLRLLQNARQVQSGTELVVYRSEDSVERDVIMTIRNRKMSYKSALMEINKEISAIKQYNSENSICCADDDKEHRESSLNQLLITLRIEAYNWSSQQLPYTSTLESSSAGSQAWLRAHQEASTFGKVLALCPYGSYRYNMQNAASDVDVYVVFQAAEADLLGIKPSPPIVARDGGQFDCVMLELRLFLVRLVDGDPCAVESLFLPCHLHRTTAAPLSALTDFRRHFLRRCLLNKYVRHVEGSTGLKILKKMIQLKKFDPSCSDLPPKVCKILYICLRLLQNAGQVILHRDMTVFREDGSEEFLFLRKIREGKVPYNEAMQTLNRMLEDVKIGYEDFKDETTEELLKSRLNQWLINVRQGIAVPI